MKTTIYLLLSILLLSSCKKENVPIILTDPQSLRVNLYSVDVNGVTLVDGTLTQYNDIYCNCVDIDDAIKLPNPTANLSILRSNTDLVVERRNYIPVTDTSYFRLWGMPLGNYRFRIVAKNLNHPNLSGFLIDSYTGTEYGIALNDTSYYNFIVNANAGSIGERFKIVFRPTQTLSNPNMQVRTKLYSVVGGIETLRDGVIGVYSPLYCNCIDANDAVKLPGGGNNIGILRAGQTLVIEARDTVNVSDTTQFINGVYVNVSNLMLDIQFSNTYPAGLSATLHDNYLGTDTNIPTGGTGTKYYYTIDNIAASYNPTRFKLILNN